MLTGHAFADPAEDALAKLNDLSRQAEQTTEAMHSAQLDLDNKLAVQQAAETKHASDLTAMESAKAFSSHGHRPSRLCFALSNPDRVRLA